MVLWAWLDSFTMILRCWLVVWVKWARPLSLWHCDPEFVQLQAFLCVGRPISWGRPTPLKVNGANFGTLLPPRGATFTPFEVWSYRACQPLQVWWFISFYEILAWATTRQSLPNALSMGLFGRLFAPGANIVPPMLIKVIAHHSRLGRTFWHLIHGSVAKTAGGVARRSEVGMGQ